MEVGAVGNKQTESVWDYPRPPRVEPFAGLIEVQHGGYVLAKSSNAFRVLETSHPPVFYIPPQDIMWDDCPFRLPTPLDDLIPLLPADRHHREAGLVYQFPAGEKF